MAYPIMAPSNTWYKTSVLRSKITEINIVDSYTPTGNETETWNADVDNSGSIKCYLNGTVLTIAGNGSGKIALNEDSSYLFAHPISSVSESEKLFITCTAINGLPIFDSSNVKNLSRVFAYCIAVTELDLTGWDVGNVETLQYTFGASEKVGTMALTTIKGVESWNTKNVSLMRTTFQNCSALTALDVSNWDTSKVTDMSYLFRGCSSLTTIPISNWDTSSCTNMSQTFSKCFGLTHLDIAKWNVSKVTNFNSMFSMSDYGTTSAPITTLDVSNWDVSSATDMGWMFYGLTSLKTLDVSKWNVSKVESFHHCFAWSRLIITGLENWDVRSAKTFNAMFHGNKTTSYDLSGWNVSNCESFGQMFEENHALVEIKGLENWNTSKGKNFYEMFRGCNILKELNLSSFDTRNASDSWVDPQRGEAAEYGGMSQMFGISPESSYFYLQGMPRLEKITLGSNFSFNGDGTCYPAILPTQTQEYIPNADGRWHTVEGAVYASANIPNMTANTYYCADPVWLRDYLVKGETLQVIADAIRAGNGSTEKYLLTDYASAIDNIAENSFEAGKKSEYDAFWDEYQNYGNYEDTKFTSERLFAFSRWTDKNFFPKYDIKIGPGGNGTAYFLFASSQITNLTQRLKDCKVVLDTSNAKAGSEMFAWCPLLTHIPTVSLIGMKDSNAKYIFAGSPNLVEIEQIILPSEGFSGGIQYWFTGAKSLTTLKIQGTILQEGFDLSPAIILSKSSIISIINALSTSTSGLTITFSLTAVNNAFETTEGAADGSTSEEWLALAATKSNWTISLV